MKKLFFFALLAGFSSAGAQQFSLIKDINPGAATSHICYLTNVNNSLFFAANNGVNGMELWKSDGTETGTVLIKDIYPGISNSSIGYLTDVNGVLFFVANNGTNGTEVWKSDGTAAGTVMLKDIRSGSIGSNPSALVNMNGVLFFAADDGVSGVELWKSDGTETGTVRLKDINALSSSSYPQSLAVVNGLLYFAADNGTNGLELWKSDGSAAGTVMVKDIWPGISDGYPYELTAIGNELLFAANDGSSGTELWRSDGTAAGTARVKDIWTGESDGFPFDLVNVGGTLFFSADNGATGIELWKSDGTAEGTMLVKDVWPGTESGAIGNFSKLINKLIFTGNDGVNGYKTWQSDGTSTGTQMAIGIAGTANTQELVETDTDIFASINESSTGSELWGLSFSTVLPLTWLDFSAKLVKTDALLNWKTTNEINTADFIIERSVDDMSYIPVGKVASASLPGVNSYKFIDANITSLEKDIIYYRLKQTDIDSRVIYSSVVTVSTKDKDAARFYPNPATNEINLMGAIFNGPVKYHVIDASGKIVAQKYLPNVSGNTSLSIDISRLSSGIYYVDFRSSHFNRRMQFVKH